MLLGTKKPNGVANVHSLMLNVGLTMRAKMSLVYSIASGNISDLKLSVWGQIGSFFSHSVFPTPLPLSSFEEGCLAFSCRRQTSKVFGENLC